MGHGYEGPSVEDAGWTPAEPSVLGDRDEEFHFRLGEETPLPSSDPRTLADARHFRDVLGRFCTGVTVVTSTSDGRPVGMTCQSFCSVSLSPPLVLFCPARTSRAWPHIQRAGFFCVNLLAAGQDDLSNGMATKGVEKFAGLTWRPSPTGAPLLDGILGYVDCTVHAVHEAGDHYVVIGRVQELGAGEAGDPLLFYRGGYTSTR